MGKKDKVEGKVTHGMKCCAAVAMNEFLDLLICDLSCRTVA